jgi:HD-GYP domain-containing protein (c-di-GMP phosphodiesterase class II)
MDDLFLEKVLKRGRSLISDFAILVKLTGVYESINEAVLNAASRLKDDLEFFLGEEGEITVKLAEEAFFIEDFRVKASVADIDNFSFLSKNLSERGIGAVTFRAPLQTDDLVFLAYAIKGGSEAAEIQSALESRLTKAITVGGPVEALKESALDTKDVRLLARRAYVKAVTSYQAAVQSLKAGKRPDLKRAKRAVQGLVDAIFKDEPYTLGLTAARNPKLYVFQHPVHVAMLSAALGKRLALNRYHLSLLGMAALFHDVGKVVLPLSILQKEGELSPLEQELLRMHPLEGLKQVLKSRGLNTLAVLTMFVALEHHRAMDGSGYPPFRGNDRPVLFSRIVQIADDFDSMVSGLVQQRKAQPVAEALKLMHSRAGTVYDEVLLRAFMDVFKS